MRDAARSGRSAFRNGGSFREGRYEGFDGAERINARFHVNGNDMREDRRDLNNDRKDMRKDRRDTREDRRDNRQDNGDARHNNGDTH